MIKKFFKKVHLWLSIPVGLIISLTCLTGAILVFQQEILELTNPSHYRIAKTSESALPLEELIPLVNSQLENNSVAAVQIPSNPQRTYTMTLKEGFRVSAFVNPYTGEVTGYYKFQESPFFTVMRLHRWLMDGTRTWGKYAVGIATLLFVIIVISGVLIMFPMKLKKKNFVVHLKKGRKRFWFDTHTVLGLYASLLLVIMSLTGLMWSFEWYRNGVFKLFGAKVEQTSGHGSGGGARGGGQNTSKEEEPLNVLHWDKVATQLRNEHPDYTYVRIQKGTANVHLTSSPTSRATDTYTFNNNTGEIKEVTLYKDSPATSKIWGWAYALHVGNFWGIWSKILVFIASLIGTALPITGYWLYYRKHLAKAKPTPR